MKSLKHMYQQQVSIPTNVQTCLLTHEKLIHKYHQHFYIFLQIYKHVYQKQEKLIHMYHQHFYSYKYTNMFIKTWKANTNVSSTLLYIPTNMFIKNKKS